MSETTFNVWFTYNKDLLSYLWLFELRIVSYIKGDYNNS